MIKSQNEIDKTLKLFYDQGKSIAFIVETISEYIYKNFEYIKGITNIETTIDEILQQQLEFVRILFI